MKCNVIGTLFIFFSLSSSLHLHQGPSGSLFCPLRRRDPLRRLLHLHREQPRTRRLLSQRRNTSNAGMRKGQVTRSQMLTLQGTRLFHIEHREERGLRRKVRFSATLFSWLLKCSLRIVLIFKRKCSSWRSFLSGDCDHSEENLMGEWTKNGSRGSFYLKTGSTPPFVNNASARYVILPRREFLWSLSSILFYSKLPPSSADTNRDNFNFGYLKKMWNWITDTFGSLG